MMTIRDLVKNLNQIVPDLGYQLARALDYSLDDFEQP